MRAGLGTERDPARVLIAPDSFKGTFAAPAVAEAIARGVERVGLTADRCPVADGGEGTAAILLEACGGERICVPTLDPLGRPIHAEIALLGDGAVAVVEAAAASGLAHLAPHELDPRAATTFGAGLLITEAARTGARSILVAAGGSATVDGGRGALTAIEAQGGIGEAAITVLCDVESEWGDCAEMYGPQKGADAAMVGLLARRLERLAETLPHDPRGVARTGAAGGLSGALWAAHDASLVSGAAFVLDRVRFEERLSGAAFVVVGEGRLDDQSVVGKIVGEIATRGKTAGVPIHAVCGSIAIGVEAAEAAGLASLTAASTLDELERSGARLATLQRDRRAATRPSRGPDRLAEET